MRDQYFFPLILLLCAGLVYLAMAPGFGRLPDGPMPGDGVNYSKIVIEDENLHRRRPGGEASVDYVTGPDGETALLITVEEGKLSADPVLGPHIPLASDLEVQFSGHTVRVTVRARPADDKGATQMRVNYSAGRAGESGWKVFDLKPGYQDYSFEYRVPIAIGDQGNDYIGVRPVVPEKTRAIYVERITFDRLGRWDTDRKEGES